MARENEPLEIGSEFHWPGVPPGPFVAWPEPHAWYALARDAFLAILAERQKAAVFVPDYFCEDVVEQWQRSGVFVRRYEDDPRWAHPRWETIDPREGDIVLAVNYFGVGDGSEWAKW